MAKTHLNTAEVFAWIAVILVLSSIFEKVGLWLFECFCDWKPRCKAPVHGKENDLPQKYVISKTYGERVIWDKLTLELEKGKIYTFRAPSGKGKTTLLRILAGLETNEAEERDDAMKRGKSITQPCSMLFQEDRLLLDETPLANIEICVGSHKREEIWQHLKELIPELQENQICRVLSGGMKRRVCLVRAMLAEGDLVLLDEPFAGLDEKTKEKAIEYIRHTQKDRIILVVTHHENDAKMLNSTHFAM